jgi:DNA-binding NtrC family response regulator
MASDAPLPTPNPSPFARARGYRSDKRWPRLASQARSVRQLEESIHRVADFDCSVLVTGETGCGKEEVARAIHAAGPRADKPFVALNCSGLVSALAESQLFGHEKGSFTGAMGASRGVFRAADGGVVFLDEIGELPLELQPRLLRVLQTWEVTPVGSTEVHKVDVQVIAATNRDLEAQVEAGEFREDLFYRLNTIHLVVPPLRKRTEDIPGFIEHFSAHYAREYGRPQWRPEPHVLAKLVAHPWPGNVRQLAQAIQRIYVFDDRVERVIADLFAASTTPDLQPLDEHPRSPASASAPDGQPAKAADQSPAWMTLQSAENMAAGEPAVDEPAVPTFNLDALRRLAVRQAIAATEGHRGRAAELLGVSLNTMTRLVGECCPEMTTKAGRKKTATTTKPR